MNPILAEASPDSSIAWNVILTIGVLVAIGANVASLFKKNTTSVTPDPLNVRNIDKLATRDFVQERDREYVRRLDGHDAEISQIREDMKDDRKQNEIHASARSAKIYDAMEKLRKELTDKIDDMPDRVIDTLNKLGKLK